MELIKNKCNHENIITDEAGGYRTCGDCGHVVEQHLVVSELSFVNNKLMGNFIGNGIDGRNISS